ncbi:hypothetical protein HA052_20510 [Chromobacterium haemolyticum]|uniref:Uncharacterized protein n=1 Tax=Chromobacterium fluminis TaxID=3044269 RepID=A0ABX0LGL0_9NEIS|nr:hypothetical protein [Chromobacterium haemolyticum]NHR07575.1 hypothetical protein [Chromobacterium haemolyticum]
MSNPYFPPRRRYKGVSREAVETLLPFVSFIPGRTYPHYWQIEPSYDSYPQAGADGREYAAHLLQWLKDNPLLVGSGLLGRIARDIDFANEQQRGVWVAFFNHLERVLSLGLRGLDVFAHVDGQHDYHLAVEASFELEGKVRKT